MSLVLIKSRSTLAFAACALCIAGLTPAAPTPGVTRIASPPIPAPLTLDGAAERYRPDLAAAIEQCYAGAQLMRERVQARDLPGAQQAWIAARIGWERAEVFTSGFTSELDAAIDAWPSAVSGFHFIEARLFGAQKLDVMPATDALLFHLSDLRMKIRATTLTGQGMLEGTAKLAYEVGESKADGGESRFSGTSLDDMRNNVDGIDTAYGLVFAAALEARDASLADAIRTKIAAVRAQLAVQSVAALDGDQVRSKSEALVIALQQAASVLGLDRPSMSDLAQQ